MNLADGFGIAQGGFGIASTIAGAWKTGEDIDNNLEAYERNSIADQEREQASFFIQEDAKNQAQFGAQVNMENYIWTGKQKLNAIEKQLNSSNEELLMQKSIAAEQTAAVDETVGNMMSRNAIDSMKAEARLVAGAAGTGTEGGTTDVAVRDARSNEQFDNAVLIGRAANDKLNISRRLSMERLSAKNKKSNIASKIATVFTPGGSRAAYDKGYAGTYAGIAPSVKQGYLSHDKVMTEQSGQWLNDIVKYGNILTQSGLMDASTELFLGEDQKEVE